MKYLLMACLLLPLSAQAFCLGEVSSSRQNGLGDTEYRDSSGRLLGTSRQNGLGETEYRDNSGRLIGTSRKQLRRHRIP